MLIPGSHYLGETPRIKKCQGLSSGGFSPVFGNFPMISVGNLHQESLEGSPRGRVTSGFRVVECWLPLI